MRKIEKLKLINRHFLKSMLKRDPRRMEHFKKGNDGGKKCKMKLLNAYDRAYEEEREAKRKKDRKEMMDGEKKIAAGLFTGRTRKCADCGQTFPWQARKVQCLECFKNSKSSSSANKKKTRTCQDCG